MRLSGHIPSYMTAERAVNDGFDEIQHINMLFLNFLAGPEDDTRTPVRFTLVADHMPPSVRRGMLAGEMDINDDNASRYARSADALLEMIGLLFEAGITLVAGTDNMAGFTLHRELELYHRAGISAKDVLGLATIGSARVAGVADKAGSISAGKRADFVLLPANPLQDISAIRGAVAVFKGDRWFDTAELYEAVGIKPFTR